MTNAVIYARFSTDKQRETSIDDQVRVCRARAQTLALTATSVHSDQGVSGSTPIASRRGGAQLLADALAGRFSVLIMESLDRLSRDSVEQESTVRRLEHRGIRIIGCADGYDSASGGKGRKLLRAMRGVINETFIDDLREKTHRGLSGQIDRGYHAGGLSYGYRSTVVGYDARGEPTGHRLVIDDEQAKTVREILERYADGQSCQRIAADLNARRVRGPRGGTWSVSAIYGSPEKGSGIINNVLYVGEYVWNRSQWIKDPDTGTRQRFMRPTSEWRVEPRAELRIVDDVLWHRVRKRIATPRRENGSKGAGRPPQTLFGGLLRCGLCGGSVVAVNARDYGCAARKDRGAAVCVGVHAPRANVDERLLSRVRDVLLSPASLAKIHARVRAAQRPRVDGGIERRLAKLDAEISRLVSAVAAMGISPGLQKRLADAERERAQLAAWKISKTVTGDGVNASAAYRRMIADLGGQLRRDAPRARVALMRVFEELKLMPDAEGRVFAEYVVNANRLISQVADVSNSGCGGVISELEHVESGRVRVL